MYYDGYTAMDVPDPQFGKLVGGRLCLDFVNTVCGRIPAGRQRDYAGRVVGERLDSYGALLRWGGLTGALTAGQARALAREASARPAKADAALKESLALREALYSVFKAAVEGWPARPGDLVAVNRSLRQARAHERLIGTARFQWAWDDTPALDRMLWPIARSAGDLLAGPDLERVRQCPGEECGWLFLDTSRSRRRQWCDMAECGNLAKVRRFRQKRT
ncbi:MAG TPA: ABATE domain-containing protein [Vicinamibacterales bacterium]|nr:ABATE domain-containing protein [Vicinamibacterales bacterium]